MPAEVSLTSFCEAASQSEWPQKSPLQEWMGEKSGQFELSARQFGLTAKEMVGPVARDLLVLTGVVGGIAAAEATLVSNEPFLSKFAFRYAAEHLLPSIIWISRPAELISLVTTGGTEALRQFSPTAADAAVQLKIASLYTLRSVVAGFWGISKIVQASGIGQEVKAAFKEKILKGKEALTGGTQEVVIRLAGSQSDVTEFSLTEDGRHVIPVFEDPDLIEDLAQKQTQGGKKPFFWHVLSGKYGEKNSWQDFKFPPEWLITDKKGQKLLIIEADASVGEQALALGEESANDLTIAEVAQARYSLEMAANQNKVKPDKSVTVLLADSQQKLKTGGGHEYTLREQIETQGEADIFIDAKAPLILAVKNWADQAIPSTDKCKTIVFNTTNSDYFTTLKEELEKMGYSVVDIGEKEKYNKKTPHLVYQATTADTAHTVRTLVSRGIVSPDACCGLFDKQGGVDKLNQFAKKRDIAHIPSICSASLYHDLFKTVRLMLRNGDASETIQARLDQLFEPVLGDNT